LTTTTETTLPTGTWTVDPIHSRVEFAAKHMGIATVRGVFTRFEGALEIADDPADSRAWGTVEVASLDTGAPDRDGHLRSADFFDAERYPEMTFESKRIEPLGGRTFRIAGDLTLRGVTREVELGVVVGGRDTDPWGNERVGLEVTGELSRSEFGMRFNEMLGSGNALVGDRVKLALDVSAVKG
jgi:polyisoprenoid-binding protein YceI